MPLSKHGSILAFGKPQVTEAWPQQRSPTMLSNDAVPVSSKLQEDQKLLNTENSVKQSNGSRMLMSNKSGTRYNGLMRSQFISDSVDQQGG
jgi:hypothetical protein